MPDTTWGFPFPKNNLPLSGIQPFSIQKGEKYNLLFHEKVFSFPPVRFPDTGERDRFYFSSILAIPIIVSPT